MSLNQLANHMSAQGRGPDSTLVHMSPREVSGLQSLAMAHGGTLTINPQTGLPEAGFLDSLLPTLLGGAATFFSGGTITPLMAAMGVGGLTALTSKDLGKGLMAGLGAYGGSGIVEGLAGFGTGALSAEAGGAAINAAGVDPLSFEADQIAQNAIAPKIANASYSDRLAAGASKAMSEPMNALSAIGGGSKFKGAAMLGAPLFSALSTQEATPAPTFQQIQFDPRPANINMRRSQLPYQPDTGSSAQHKYFTPMTIDQYGADGGFVADGGIQHFASGGVPLDPNYDYSGYGRKKSTPIVPVVKPKDVPKPDFVGADGKTYRYDTMKKSWYVIKDAAAKTNPGVEVLMGGQGGEGGAGDYGSKGAGTFTGDPNSITGGFLSSVIGTQLPAPVVDKSTFTPAAIAEAQAAQEKAAAEAGRTAATIEGLQKDPETNLAPGELAGSPQQSATSAQAQAQAAERDTQQARAEINAAPAAGLAALADIQQDVAARAAEVGKTPGAFAEEGLAGIAAQAQAAADNAREASMSVDAPAPAPAAAAPAPAPAAAAAAPAAPSDEFAAPAFDIDAGAKALADVNAFSDKLAGVPSSMMSAPFAQVTASNTTGFMAADDTNPDAAPEVTGPSAGDYGGPTAAPAADVSGIAALDSGPTAAPAADVSGIAALDSGPSAAPEATGPSAGDYGGPSAAPEATGPSAGDYGGPSAAPEATGPSAGDYGGPSAAPEAAAPEAAAPEAAGPGGGGETGDGGGDGDGGGGEGGEANGGMVGRYAQGGLGSLGGYSDGGRLLRGPGDGVSDHIPATIGRTRQPARLADGEFVVPARIVSELGNGSTEAGARALYKMMDRIQANRRKTTGKNSVAVDSKARKYLPA